MKTPPIAICTVLLLLILTGCSRERGADHTTWREYKGDSHSSSYSSLDQINRENVDQLEVSWIYRTNDLAENARSSMQTNPIVVDGILYGASPRLKIFAVDAATGEEIWTFDPFGERRGGGTLRGVSFWSSGADRRILFTASNHLYALNAENGSLIRGFGTEGRVDLREGLGKDVEEISIRATSPGRIYKDLLILGSSVGEFYGSAPGHIRAYNVVSGEQEWIFHTIPRIGEPGIETWHYEDEEELLKRGGVNSWAGLSVDVDRGIAYVPLGSPVYDFYGGDRPGENLYGNSLVALDAATGEYIWHYQTVRHDLWDYDLPAPPNLLTIHKDGTPVDVVAQVSKQGFTFVLERETGEPVFPVREVEVLPSDVEGERSWPSQPVPELPEPFARQRLSREDINDFTPELRDSLLKVFSTYRSKGLYTPPSYEGTIHFPSTLGGANWGGAAHDPESGVLYINSNEMAEIITIEERIEEIEPVVTADSPYEIGRTFYMANCSICHGANREGQHPSIPALDNPERLSSREDVVAIITAGLGRMPGFPTITEKEKEGIIHYLYGIEGEIHDGSEPADRRGHTIRRFVNSTAYRDFLDIDGYPGIKPPWGTMNAIDLNTGRIKWKVPLGEFPELTEKGFPITGRESWGGPIVTKGGLVFIAGTGDSKFRAFDKETGKILWETELPTGGFATPATYEVSGKQYVVIAVGGGRGTESGDYYIAFSLPDPSRSLRSDPSRP